MPAVLVINGPNINLLGKRETGIYGSQNMEQINSSMRALASELGLDIEFMQSNHEGEIVEAVQNAAKNADAIIINPAAFTHTSVAIRDAFLASQVPFVEVHLSNTAAREPFRQKSMLSDLAKGTIAGFGPDSYMLALRALHSMLQSG